MLCVYSFTLHTPYRENIGTKPSSSNPGMGTWTYIHMYFDSVHEMLQRDSLAIWSHDTQSKSLKISIFLLLTADLHSLNALPTNKGHINVHSVSRHNKQGFDIQNTLVMRKLRYFVCHSLSDLSWVPLILSNAMLQRISLQHSVTITILISLIRHLVFLVKRKLKHKQVRKKVRLF